MRCKSHVMITVGPTLEEDGGGERGRRTFILAIFFPLRAVFRLLLVGVTGVYVRHQNGELTGIPGGKGRKDTQRNVNLSPGTAPATSRPSSRICSMRQC